MDYSPISIDFDFDTILSEAYKLSARMEEDIKKSVKDIVRATLLNTGASKNINKLEEEFTTTQVHIKKEIDVLEEAAMKTKTIHSELSKLTARLSDIKEAKASIKKAITAKPEHAESYTEKLKRVESLCDRTSKEMKDLEDLNKSVLEKVIKTRKSIKERSIKSIDFYEALDVKTREAIEKSVVGLLFKEEKAAQSTDVCFMIDCTGSMSRYIANARDTIVQIIDTIKRTFEAADIRVAIIGYRDIKDTKRFEIFEFSETVVDAKNFLNSLSAQGGGDGPEDVNGAFQKAFDLSWRQRTKNLIHIADAPCHGLNMNGQSNGDDFPEGHMQDAAWEGLIGDLKTKEINYLFLKIGNSADFMFKRFSEIYWSTRQALSMELIFEAKQLTDDKDLFTKLTTVHIKNSITSSIKSTYFKLRDHSKYKDRLSILPAIKDEPDDENSVDPEISLSLSNSVAFTLPDWNNSSFFTYNVSAKSYYIFGTGTLEDVINKKVNHTTENVQLKIRNTPFGQGEFSQAFHCRAKPSYSKVYFNMALKRSKTPVKKAFYFQTIEKNTLTNLLAKDYNLALKKAGFNNNYRIYFTRVLVVKVGADYFLLEAFIPGEFEKYTNNFNYVNENVPLLIAFSHFCYHSTNKKFMVTDLQGSNNLLTDPVIHSSTVRYPELGDLGTKGMMAFFRHHQCNEYCKKLGLPPHEAQRKDTGSIFKGDVKFDVSSYYKKCKYYFCNANAGDQSMCPDCRTNVDISKGW